MGLAVDAAGQGKVLYERKNRKENSGVAVHEEKDVFVICDIHSDG